MKLNRLILLIVTFTLLLIGVHTSPAVFGAPQALSENEVSKKYGVTFPVTELNNCGSIAECGAYCRKDGNLPS